MQDGYDDETELIVKPCRIGSDSLGFVVPKWFQELDKDYVYGVKIRKVRKKWTQTR